MTKREYFILIFPLSPQSFLAKYSIGLNFWDEKFPENYLKIISGYQLLKYCDYKNNQDEDTSVSKSVYNNNNKLKLLQINQGFISIEHGCYSHGKWNRQSKFKSWMKLFAFHFTLMYLRKALIHLFSSLSPLSRYGKIKEQPLFSSLGLATSEEGKFWIQTNLNWPSVPSCLWWRG